MYRCACFGGVVEYLIGMNVFGICFFSYESLHLCTSTNVRAHPVSEATSRKNENVPDKNKNKIFFRIIIQQS